MKKIFPVLLLIIFFGSGCRGPANLGKAAIMLRIESAPDVIAINPQVERDSFVTVTIENYTDASLFESELATAYLEYYEVTIFINDEQFSIKKIPARVVIKQGASVNISTLIFTEEELRETLKRFGNFNSIIGYAVIKYYFSDTFGNREELTYKPVIRISE